MLIPTSDVLPPEIYIRQYTDCDSLEQLAHSIETQGMLFPITVRSADNGKYIVISGERRRRAAVMARLSFIPCLLVSADSANSLLYDLTAEMHSEMPHFLECATVIDRLHSLYGIKKLSELLCVPEGRILSKIKMLSFPDNVKQKIIAHNLSESVCVSLTKIERVDRLNTVVDMLIDGFGINEAMELTEKDTQKTVLSAYFKDLTVFENTIEHAVNTMKAAGVNARSHKSVSDEQIVYTVTIPKNISEK